MFSWPDVTGNGGVKKRIRNIRAGENQRDEDILQEILQLEFNPLPHQSDRRTRMDQEIRTDLETVMDDGDTWLVRSEGRHSQWFPASSATSEELYTMCLNCTLKYKETERSSMISHSFYPRSLLWKGKWSDRSYDVVGWSQARSSSY